MPVYVIERNFAEQLDLTHEDVELIDEINADEGVRWLFSFLSADRRRTYCLYEAPSADAIMARSRWTFFIASDVPKITDWGGTSKLCSTVCFIPAPSC